MNRSTPALATIVASLTLMTGSAFAHDPPTSAASDSARPDEVKTSTTVPTETGTKTVRSGMPAQPAAGPAPPFAVLDKKGRGFLDQSDAEGYPLLSTDFIKADANRDGKVSKVEYENWVKQP
ncbi:MAG: EF-hand domain-containing protein [Dokdonella sp.]